MQNLFRTTASGKQSHMRDFFKQKLVRSAADDAVLRARSKGKGKKRKAKAAMASSSSSSSSSKKQRQG